jgi:hypothetical protein
MNRALACAGGGVGLIANGGALMAKGLITQTACVLMHRPVSPQQVEGALAPFQVCGRHDAAESWAFGGPSVTVPFRPEVNGLVVVDVVDCPWPDQMGDPKTDPILFGAWSMGQFGPFTFPGGLLRASQQSWSWEPGKTVPSRHKAFLRVRSSYVFGAGGDAPVMPGDYDPVPELQFVTDVALAALGLTEALCYFNPNGEVLRDREGVRESLEYAQSANLLPLDLWCNVRLFNVDADWSLMDTVGNHQLDLPDVEACFSGGYDCAEVDRFLRNVSWYLCQNGEVIKDGDTMDGPGEVRWQARNHENGLAEPPRRVLSWLPLDGTNAPDNLRER